MTVSQQSSWPHWQPTGTLTVIRDQGTSGDIGRRDQHPAVPRQSGHIASPIHWATCSAGVPRCS